MNKKGFTLIELLAVIIILGILMIIAIPSVTRYINDSRKSAYVDTAKEIISGTRTIVNEGKLGMYDTNTTYYIPAGCIQTENSLKSPYGEFTKAYVGVIYNGTGYKYYWISVDDTGQGIRNITPQDKLEPELIESDLKDDDIENVVESTGVGNRSEIKILNCTNNSWDRQYHLDNISNNIPEEGVETSIVVYPTGKTKETVEVGEIVTIGTEEFYVVKHDGNDLVLLAHYNLKVGNICNNSTIIGEYTSSDPGYGLQSSEVKAWQPDEADRNGTVEFSSSFYWNGKVGTDYPGTYSSSNTYTPGTVYAYVYDSNSNLKQYVDAYKIALEGMGATIKEARLLRIEEAFELGCGNGTWSCISSPATGPSWLVETSFWLGTPYSNIRVWRILATGLLNNSADFGNVFGVRPVIVI